MIQALGEFCRAKSDSDGIEATFDGFQIVGEGIMILPL